ncbi:FIST N-terminal domain-containing protein [Thioclava sp. GXIMD4216]|uniref:FIST N-terminal domain-containing protein n=1 Tax=Thioclava sp. GXIMD4216 TaxID=3131929 RepID=UPI0030CFE1C5
MLSAAIEHRRIEGALMPLTASVSADAARPLQALSEELGAGPFALVLLFCSPQAQIGKIVAEAEVLFSGSVVAGCTTSGELTRHGYSEGQILAFAFPQEGFEVEPVLVSSLAREDARQIIEQITNRRQAMALREGAGPNEFALLLADGTNAQEDALLNTLSGGLGPVPVFGGSAGDGGAAGQTCLFLSGRLYQDAAILLLVRAHASFRMFSVNHLVPTGRRMVVTQADPARRAVLRINDEPAAAEYARLLGVAEKDLCQFLFSINPVQVRVGGRYYVRSIRECSEDGGLVFFSAIDRGLVLTLARPQNMVRHLEDELERLSQPAAPGLILAFDCIFRRIEVEGRQIMQPVSDLLRRYNVQGFSTYGEQFGAMHVNQTFTGIAFYSPLGRGPRGQGEEEERV